MPYQVARACTRTLVCRLSSSSAALELFSAGERERESLSRSLAGAPGSKNEGKGDRNAAAEAAPELPDMCDALRTASRAWRAVP